LEVGTLGDQDIFGDADFGYDHRKSIQRSALRNQNRRLQFVDIKNTPEVFFAVFHKIE
jgi:hypothetical protein